MWSSQIGTGNQYMYVLLHASKRIVHFNTFQVGIEPLSTHIANRGLHNSLHMPRPVIFELIFALSPSLTPCSMSHSATYTTDHCCPSSWLCDMRAETSHNSWLCHCLLTKMCTTRGLQPTAWQHRRPRARFSRMCTQNLELCALVNFKDMPPLAAEGLLLRQLSEARWLKIRCEAAAAADVLVVAHKHDAARDHDVVHRLQKVLDLLGRVNPPPVQQSLSTCWSLPIESTRDKRGFNSGAHGV